MKLINSGISNNSPNMTVIGFFVALFFIISTTVIQSKKMSGDYLKEHFRDPVNDTPDKISASYMNIKTNMFSFLSDNFFYLYDMKYIIVLVGLFLSMIMFLSTFSDRIVLTNIAGFVFLFSIYMTVLIKSMRENNDKE